MAVSGSLDAVPSRFTRVSSLTVWSLPASAVGAMFVLVMVMTTVSVEVRPPSSVTVNCAVTSVGPSKPTCGARKLGVTVVRDVKAGGPLS